MIKNKSIKSDVGVVIPAAGSGVRFGEKKQFKLLSGRPIYYHALLPFLDIEAVSEIVVVMPEDAIAQADRELRSVTTAKSVRAVPGGARRQDSVYNGVKALSDACRFVCIHDAVRPFITHDQILNTIESGRNADGAILAVPAKDTVKQVESDRIKRTIPRETIWLAQTPQVFRRTSFEKAILSMVNTSVLATDESAIMEESGFQISVVEGSPLNMKITAPEDWIIAEAVMNKNEDRV